MLIVFMANIIITIKPTFPATTAVAAENLDLVADPARNCVAIMKDGKIYKNTVKPFRSSR